MAAEGTHHSPASDIAATVDPGTGWDASGLAKETGGNLASAAARLVSTGLAAAADILASVLSAIGATDGAAVITDANGTVQQYLRGLIKTLAVGTNYGTLLNAADMAVSQSCSQSVAGLKYIGIQLTAPSNTHAGTFAFGFSMDGNVANYTQTTTSRIISAESGVALNAWIDIDVYGPYLHVVYTPTGGAGALTVKMFGKG